MIDQPIFTYNRTKMQLKELELSLENAQLSYAMQQLTIERNTGLSGKTGKDLPPEQTAISKTPFALSGSTRSVAGSIYSESKRDCFQKRFSTLCPKSVSKFESWFWRRERHRSEQNQTYTIRYDMEEESATVDLSQGESGWMSLGTFYLPKGEVTVSLSDKVSGQFVVNSGMNGQSVTCTVQHRRPLRRESPRKERLILLFILFPEIIFQFPLVSAKVEEGGNRWGGFRPGGGNTNREDNTQYYVVPPRSAREIKIINDERPARLIINTNISQNLPNEFTYNFSKVDNEISDTLVFRVIFQHHLVRIHIHQFNSG